MKSILKDKFIVVGVTGGIAAYKAPILVRRLKEKGANVQVVMTENAKKFVTPLALETVSNNKVITSMFKEGDNVKVEHIDMADRADFVVIAPVTANTLSKISCGLADDFLTSMLLAYGKKVLFVPAMNVNMYQNPFIKRNMEILKKIDNYFFMDADEGELACGYSGKGRMPDPPFIVKEIEYLLSDKPLLGKKILITAGATKEFMDPVRYISNPSSGKMGYSLAKICALYGAEVTLLTHKGCLDIPYRVKKVKYFENVDSLKTLLDKLIPENDILIMSAAVGDIKVKNYSKNKIKKNNIENIEFENTVDILKSIKDKKIFKIGFAAESDNHESNAFDKLNKKNLDMIILNDISKKGIGFESDYNAVTIITKDDTEKIERLKKEEIAYRIMDKYLKIHE